MHLRACLITAIAACTSAAASPRATVAVLATDMPHLSAPVSLDGVPSDEMVENLVREAMELGGIRQVVKPETRHVLLKPCIVTALRNPQRNTDPRVVRAVALTVHDVAPRARITVAEGPGAWMAEERPEVHHWEVVIADGFETEGYRAALDDPRLADADIDFVDLNLAEARLVDVPGGGMARDAYWIPAIILEADVAITIPRIKAHTEAVGGITVAMKNQIGVAPGLKYGWPKKTGYPSDSGNPGIPHSQEILGETITDLNLCAGMDFAVAEAFRRDIDEHESRHSAWLNAVVAGADLVAVDAVSSVLMSRNPEEVETVVNGERRGLGVGRLEAIDLKGETDLGRLRKRIRPRDSSGMGMANRIWIVSGPYPQGEEGMAAVQPARAIAPGLQGFGDPVWFQDDACDLRQLLGKPTQCVAFAYCEFDAPRTEAALLQLSSDEGMTVWLNGEPVYRYRGHRRVERPNDTVPVQVRQGRNRLLCRLEQSWRSFLFSANVVAAEPDSVAGTHLRISGLRFTAPAGLPLREVLAEDLNVHQQRVRRGWWRDASVDQTRLDSLVLAGVAPEALQADAAGITKGRYLGEEMQLSVRSGQERIEVRAAHAAEVWLDARALLSSGGKVTVSVVDLRLERSRHGTAESAVDSSVVWSGSVSADHPVLVLARPDTAGPWQSCWQARPPDPESFATVVGETTGELAAAIWSMGLSQSAAAVMLADAYREATGSDLAIALGWEPGGLPIPPGTVTRGSLLELIWPRDAHLVSWTITGAQVDALVEGLVTGALEEWPADMPQLAGFTATVDPSGPAGQRVEVSVDPSAAYRITCLAWYADWWQGMANPPATAADGDAPQTGGWPDFVVHPLTPIQAAAQYLAAHRPYRPVTEIRLAEVPAAQ